MPTMLRCLLPMLVVSLGFTSAPAQTGVASPANELKALLDEDVEAAFRRFPLQATVRGVPGYNHLLPDLSFETRDREHARERRTLERLQRLDAKALRGQDRISYELLLDKMQFAVEGQRFREAEALVLTTGGGLHNLMPRAAQVTPFRTVDDYRDYIRRITATPKLADDTIARLKSGLASGWMSTRPVVDRIVAAIDAHLVDNVEQSALLSPFAKMAPGITDAERAALMADARRAIADDYQPALRRYRAFILNEYRPKAPEIAGLASFQGGADYYEYLIRSRIVRSHSARQIHELGLAEVDAVRKEIGAIVKEVGFDGTTDRVHRALADRPQILLQVARSRSGGIPRARAARRSASAEALSHRAAHAVRGAQHDTGRSGQQLGGELSDRLVGAWHQRLLHDQRAGLRERGYVAHRDAVSARDRSGPSSSERTCRGDRRPASVAIAGQLQHRVRRGLGAVCRVARQRARLLHGSVPALRKLAGPPVPRRAPGRRHRASTPSAGRATRRSPTWLSRAASTSYLPKARSIVTSRTLRRRLATSWDI